MPIVCINRPKRSKPRLYNCKDVERIIRYALRNPDVSKRCVVTAVLDATDTRTGICEMVKLWRLLRDLQDNAFFVAILSAIITIISGLSAIIRGGGRRRTGLLGIAAAAPAAGLAAWLRRLLGEGLSREAGKILVALGTLQTILILIRESLDTIGDVILPVLENVACPDEEE